jgi:tRNA threonylcarbamoyladenosine biosynthesis protein TsaB
VNNLLVVDTSTQRAAIGVQTRLGQTHALTSDAGRQHGRDLIASIRAILGMAQLATAEIELVGVGLGPGSYTGLRVGLTAAKTIAYATGALLVGLDSLEAIAGNAPPEADLVAVIADAQRGDLYVSDWVRNGPGGPLHSTQPCRIESLPAWLGRLDPGALVLGPALQNPEIRAAIPAQHLVAHLESNFPDPEHLIQLAVAAHAVGLHADLWTLEPRYLRRSSAEDKWEARRRDG